MGETVGGLAQEAGWSVDLPLGWILTSVSGLSGSDPVAQICVVIFLVQIQAAP